MQDNYVGDIGDYGKYGLLRTVCLQGLSLSVNWYKVRPKKSGKQEDGKYVSYLSKPAVYRSYDSELFDALYNVVCRDCDRSIQRIEKENLFEATYFSDEIVADRSAWHQKALNRTIGTDIVFLDPDNGLETKKMFLSGKTTEKHVKWSELKDYYQRGQNVILYQHRPQMTKKVNCIDDVMRFNREYLNADCVMLLEFPKYTNRFYFMFIRKEYKTCFEQVCDSVLKVWGKDDFCRNILV